MMELDDFHLLPCTGLGTVLVSSVVSVTIDFCGASGGFVEN